VEVTSYGDGRATIDGGNGSGLISEGASHLTIRELNFVGSGRKEGNAGNGVSLSSGEGLEVDHVDVSGFREVGLTVSGVRNARITYVHAYENGQAGISSAAGGSPTDWSEEVYIGHCVAENNPGNPVKKDNHSGNGIVVGCVRDCLIEYCEAMSNGWDMPRKGNGPVGIWAWNADKVIIQFCVAHDNKSPGWDGGGFDFDGGVTNSILQYNYSHDNVGPGYFLCQYADAPTWKNNIVRYNISVNDGTENNVGCGIEVICGRSGGMSDAEVYGNTVYSEKGGAVGFGMRPVPRVRFRNNVFVAGGEMIQGDSSRARFEGNLYWAIGEDGFVAGDHKGFEEWVAATGHEKKGGSIVGLYADPLLADLGAAPSVKPAHLASLAAYRLREGSPCIGAGVPVEDNGGRDFWGSAVPEGEKLSIGACEEP
jgi:hypothetical protein